MLSLQEHGVECYMPANGETVTIRTAPQFMVSVDKSVLAETHCGFGETSLLHGALVVKDGGSAGNQQRAQVLSIQNVSSDYNAKHSLL